MQHTQLTQQVRDLVHSELGQLGMGEEEPHETILLANGHYAGRRFEAACGTAIWFLEEGQLKVYGENGQMVKTIRLHAHSAPAARAA